MPVPVTVPEDVTVGVFVSGPVFVVLAVPVTLGVVV